MYGVGKKVIEIWANLGLYREEAIKILDFLKIFRTKIAHISKTLYVTPILFWHFWTN